MDGGRVAGGGGGAVSYGHELTLNDVEILSLNMCQTMTPQANIVINPGYRSVTSDGHLLYKGIIDEDFHCNSVDNSSQVVPLV